ncbi:MAG: mechanosensitive ion channel family protein [Burkholderiales bacterium]|nr:mechanosensitive ion channel family protein [Burkholderiales bacterium]
MQEWFHAVTIWNNSPIMWLQALITVIVLFVLLQLARYYFAKRLQSLSQRLGSKLLAAVAEVLGSTSTVLMGAVSLLAGLEVLELPGRWPVRVEHAWFIVIGLQVGRWFDRAVVVWSRDHLRAVSAGGSYNPVTATVLTYMSRFVVWATLLLATLDNLGVNITAFVASLGIGGVAVALALQTVLSDLFASLSIGIDKPFEIGDFVIFGDTLGSIEHIGLKTTRIRSLGGEQIICSNTELLRQTIRNYKRMAQRRIVFGFRISYQTPYEQVREIPALVKQIITNIEASRFDRAHFKSFGTDALEYEVVYFVLVADFNRYMDIQQQINLELFKALQERGVHFAFPARTVHLASTPSRPVESMAA